MDTETRSPCSSRCVHPDSVGYTYPTEKIYDAIRKGSYFTKENWSQAESLLAHIDAELVHEAYVALCVQLPSTRTFAVHSFRRLSGISAWPC